MASQARPRDSKGRFLPAPTPVTAAAIAVPTDTLERTIPRPNQPWQVQAWQLWRQVGVLHYPTSFMAEQVMRCNWDVEVDGEKLEADEAQEIMESITAPMGPGEAARRIALNLEVAGEVYYIRSNDEWKVVASVASKLSEKLRGADVTVATWQADPVEPDSPDSPVRAALEVAEEIRVIEALSRAQTRNRLAQRGILLYPSEGQFPEGSDFQSTFEEVMTAPIKDEFAASAVAPPTIKFPGDLIEKWRHLVLDSPYDERLQERLDNAIRRLALSLNMAPEILLGLGDTNRWNSFIIEESVYRAHVEPLATLTGSCFAVAAQKVAGREDIKIFPDPSELLARRSSVGDAFRGLRLGVVGPAYVRDAMGADEEDAPTPEELRIIALLTAGIGAAEAISGQAPQAPERTPVRPPPVDRDLPAPEPVSGAVGTDPDELDTLARALVDLDIRLLGYLQGAAETAVDRARFRIQNSNGEGPQVITEVSTEEASRLGKAWDRQLRAARRTLRKLGLDARGPEWDDGRQTSIALLEEGIAAFIQNTATLTDSDLPSIPTDLLREAVAVAGGSPGGGTT